MDATTECLRTTACRSVATRLKLALVLLVASSLIFGAQVLLRAEEPTKPQLVVPGIHVGFIYAAAFSRGGARFVTTAENGTAIVWDVGTGAQLCGFAATADIAAFSPDGKQVALGSRDGSVAVWDVEVGKKLRTLKWHVASVCSVAFCKNGTQLLTASNDRSAILWEVATGRKLRAFNAASPITAAVFKPDETQIAAALSDGSIVLWDPATGKKIRTLNARQASDAAGAAEDERVAQSRSPYPKPALAFSPDGKRLLASSRDKTAIMWNTETGEKLYTLEADSTVRFAEFSHDGKQALIISYNEKGMFNSQLEVFDASNQQKLRTLNLSGEFPLALSPDEKRIAATKFGRSPGERLDINLLDIATGESVRSFRSHLLAPLAFSRDGQQIALGDGLTAVVFQPSEPRQIVALRSHEGHGANGAAFRPDGKCVAVGRGRSLMAWDLPSGTMALNCDIFPWYESIVFSPDGKQVVACANGEAKLLDASAGTVQTAFSGGRLGGRCAAFTPDGKYIALGGQEIVLYHAATGGKSRDFAPKLQQGFYSTITFSADGKRLAAVEPLGSIELWDVPARRLLHTLGGSAPGFSPLAFSPDGSKLISTTYDKTAILWDTASGDKLRTFVGPAAAINCVCFSQDGKLVAAGSGDGTAVYWDATTGEKALTVLVSNEEQSWIAATPDGLFDASASGRKSFSFRVGAEHKVVPAEQLGSDFYRPGLVGAILAGKRPK